MHILTHGTVTGPPLPHTRVQDCDLYPPTPTPTHTHTHVQDCDLALLRRFDRRILLPLPEPASRRAMVEGVLARPEIEAHLLSPADITLLVTQTDGGGMAGGRGGHMCVWGCLSHRRRWGWGAPCAALQGADYCPPAPVLYFRV